MDVITIAMRMENYMDYLDEIGESLPKLSTEKALESGEYDKEIALTIIRLKNGVELELDGQKIKNPIGSITEKLAKGICWQKKIKMETAEASYKIALLNDIRQQSLLNACQSINRHLKDSPR